MKSIFICVGQVLDGDLVWQACGLVGLELVWDWLPQRADCFERRCAGVGLGLYVTGVVL